ncbi:MAG TPA: class I SAM-dependent methyltransferase [Bryobacteraceae bacterium]|nr:class I SAM-dependent methyltransferase [Bryobacteraceae bacterium]
MRTQLPSRTAEYMALFRAVETAEPPRRRLFEDPYALPLLRGVLKALAEFARLPVAGRAVPAFLDLGWPSTRSSGVVRTRMIDDLVRDAIAAGARQLVLLGAGFDSRAFRLPEAHGMAVFEVDHPATQNAKRRRLSRFGPPPENVRFVEVDFERDDLERALLQAGFDGHCPAAVVWEGVVSYLTAPAVDANLAVLARLLAPGSRLIFTYVHQGALDGSVAFRGAWRWKFWVRFRGEPFLFGFDPASLPDYLRARSFTLQSDRSTADGAQIYCLPHGRKETGSGLYRVAAALRVGA